MLLRKNFAAGLLASPLTTGSSTMTLQSGHNLPTATGNFVVIIWNISSYSSPAADPNIEILLASYSGTPNIYNITRAQEGTSASTHATGDKVALTITAGVTTADMLVLGTKDIDEANLGAGKVPVYNATTGKFEYNDLSGGGDMLKSIYDPTSSGKISIAAGGTGQVTAQAAIDALTGAAGKTPGYVWKTDGTNGSYGVGYTVPVASAGNNFVVNDSGTYQSTNAAYEKLIEYNVPKSGTLRIHFTLDGDALADKHPYARIYRNGSAVGTERSADGAYSEDISGWAVNDLLQVYMKQSGGTTATVTLFKISEDTPSQYTKNLP